MKRFQLAVLVALVALVASGGQSAPVAGTVYVALQGSDSNDCRSWDTACLHIMNAYDKLPAAGGTVYITAGTLGGQGPSCTAKPGEGIWIMSAADPNYANPPAGWRHEKATVSFVGVSTTANFQNAIEGGVTPVSCGDTRNAAIKISGGNGYTFSHLMFTFPKKVAELNIDSNGNRANPNIGLSNVLLQYIDGFINVNSPSGGDPRIGPTIDIGSNTLWVRIEHCGLQANEAAPPNTDARSAILVDTGIRSDPGRVGQAGLASGLIYVDDVYFTGGGGIRYNAHQSGSGSIYVSNVLMEGAGDQEGGSQPVFEVINKGVFNAIVNLQGGISDSSNLPPLIKVAEGNNVWETTVQGLVAYDSIALEGPMTVLGRTEASSINGAVSTTYGVPTAITSPLSKNQKGVPQGVLLDQTDAHRRAFSPDFVRFQNRAPYEPSNWSASAGTTITPGVTAPDGTAKAAKVSRSTPGEAIATVTGGKIAYAAGDYIFIGAWVQQASPAGTYISDTSFNSTVALSFPFGGSPATRLIAGSQHASSAGSSGALGANPYYQNDGNWQWVWALSKVTGAPGSYGTQFNLRGADSKPMNFYAPMFVKIPSSALALVTPPGFAGAAESGNIATFNTTGPHNLSTGEPIVVSGCSVAGYNGEFTIKSTPSSTRFTVYISKTGLGAPAGCVFTPGNDSEAAEYALNAVSTGACAVGLQCSTRNGPITGGNFRTVSADTSIGATDGWVNVTGAHTVTVPHDIIGLRWMIFNSGTGTVRVKADSGTINGKGDITLSSNTGAMTICDGTNCFAQLGGGNLN